MNKRDETIRVKAHNPKVEGSNPPPATHYKDHPTEILLPKSFSVGSLQRRVAVGEGLEYNAHLDQDRGATSLLL